MICPYMNNRYTVRVMMFVSKKPNLTLQILLFTAAPAIVTCFLTTSYGYLLFDKCCNFLLSVIRIHSSTFRILWPALIKVAIVSLLE